MLGKLIANVALMALFTFAALATIAARFGRIGMRIGVGLVILAWIFALTWFFMTGGLIL